VSGLLARVKRRAYHTTAVRRLVFLPADLGAAVRRRRTGELAPPKGLVAVGPGDWDAIGREFLDYFVRFADLRPDERVLDVGCGIGRIAVPLTRYLSDEGSYEGFDVVARGIAWAQRHITPRYPNFRFQVADVHNQTYNPTGRQSADRYTFPFPDASFDFVFMTSVFTHMLPGEVERYLRETARVLRPGGRCLITWFLLDDESRRLLEEGRTLIAFPEDRGTHRLMDPKLPEENVAYDVEEARRLYAACGLTIREPIRGGFWAGRAAPTSYQDFVVAEKS
jgi:SAM-dependent methyltransferase